ncbi:MAG: type II toxin-antitoxin system RelE/ParE family toxin [Bacteroidetes bacterium]|nr:type II toxin-antitoxin system RelE/ParE family toxin [Bacteroidota bacterium]MBU1579670.1 type II toxin-antitoxin system RelE/ParE family toxin [Bacteroidota bacterium]MBU2464755.1 type II toxin-antitoxin system RelE/ParE family toxin [Bacteroidota bacterium]MBU2558922.1 type II toxin-antitoxin system RelE/ParE family toxin [Bacteroidota bacterium]
MKNTFNVIWSKRAKTDLKKIIDYFEENWTEKEIGTFFRKLDKQILIIQKQPNAFPATKHKNVRRSVLSRQTTIYYDILKDSVRIITLFDTRQSPEKIKF